MVEKVTNEKEEEKEEGIGNSDEKNDKDEDSCWIWGKEHLLLVMMANEVLMVAVKVGGKEFLTWKKS